VRFATPSAARRRPLPDLEKFDGKISSHCPISLGGLPQNAKAGRDQCSVDFKPLANRDAQSVAFDFKEVGTGSTGTLAERHGNE
jgi:hypothetical protein